MQLAAAGSVLSAYGTILAGNAAARQGEAQQTAFNYQADELRQQAGQTRAASQRTADNSRLAGDYAISRARAVAGASGGGVTDPTVNTVVGNLAGRSEYNALSDLFTGEERARGLETQAGLDNFQGDQAYRAGQTKKKLAYIQAGATVLGSGSDLYSKYGMGGPTPPSSMPDIAWNQYIDPNSARD